MMRAALLAPLLLFAIAVPASAQRAETVEQRVARIEKELRAVQRKVFPGGAGMTIEPEIGQPRQPLGPAGVPASSAIADLSARLDSIEAQVRSLTGQAEENAHRLRQLEESMTRFRSDVENRLAAPVAVEAPPVVGGAAPTETAAADATAEDPGEAAYTAGYRLWNAGKFTEAQAALEAWVKKYPRHPRASFARNLLGRAYLDGGKPATAAKVLLGNYQADPKGDRAQDSLYYLGQALVELGKRQEACRVYDELQDVYGASIRAPLKQQLPKVREKAKCG